MQNIIQRATKVQCMWEIANKTEVNNFSHLEISVSFLIYEKIYNTEPFLLVKDFIKKQ